MPYAAPRACSITGCPNRAARRGLCDPHERARQRDVNARRPTSDGFYRSAFWRRRSAEVVARDVTCQVGGCSDPCTDADHIVPREAGGSDDLDNLLGLCRRHHSAKTAARDGGFGNPRGGGL